MKALSAMGCYLLSVVDEELELLQIAARTSAGRSPRLDAADGALIDGPNGELTEWTAVIAAHLEALG